MVTVDVAELAVALRLWRDLLAKLDDDRLGHHHRVRLTRELLDATHRVEQLQRGWAA